MSTIRAILTGFVVLGMLIFLFAGIGGISAGESGFSVLPLLIIGFAGGFLALEFILAFGRLDHMEKVVDDIADALDELLEEQKKTNSILTRAAERQKSRLNRE